jgi:hypothetical protein
MRIARVLQSSSLIELNDAEHLGVTEQGKNQPQQHSDHEKQLAKHSRNCSKAESLAVVRLFHRKYSETRVFKFGFPPAHNRLPTMSGAEHDAWYVDLLRAELDAGTVTKFREHAGPDAGVTDSL